MLRANVFGMYLLLNVLVRGAVGGPTRIPVYDYRRLVKMTLGLDFQAGAGDTPGKGSVSGHYGVIMTPRRFQVAGSVAIIRRLVKELDSHENITFWIP